MEARFFRALYRARTYPLLVIPKRQAVDQTMIWRWLRGLRLTPRAARVPERAVQKEPSRRQRRFKQNWTGGQIPSAWLVLTPNERYRASRQDP